MAFAHCATPLSLSCAHLVAKSACSSSFPSQCHRSRLRTSFALHFPAPKVIQFPITSSPATKTASRSVKSAPVCRGGDLAVVTKDTWDEYVLNSDVPVLVEFWAAWCGPCRMVHREIEEIANEYIGRVNCYMLKADDDIEIADKYGVKVVPVVLLFKNGAKHESVTGTMPNHVYVAAIEKLL